MLRFHCVCCEDMEKFPLRLKDNELLVNQLYEDPDHEAVTALSVYLTPNICKTIACCVVLCGELNPFTHTLYS